ncbi:MAG: carbohydrate ABC transporter permease [Eubacteriales bacterium]|nr:carbohydrate ABC transporter permease [Eubacteriales bacterium]
MTKRSKFVIYFVLSLAAFISVFPLLWMAISASNNSQEILGGKLLPGVHLVENYENLLKNQALWRAFYNSARNAILVTFLSLLVSSLAGYAFEVYHDKHKDRLFAILLLAMMIPFAAIMIPLFQVFAGLHLISSVWAVVLPTISTPFLIMLFRQSARSFPRDMIEAARMDGLSEFMIFLRMFVPTMKSTYAAAMTVTFMGAWNNYMWPKVILMEEESITLPMLTANLTAGYVTDFGQVMLAVLITTIPTVVIFFSLQNAFSEGITGTVK